MDVFGAKVLGRALQPGVEVVNAGTRVQVCLERGVLGRRKQRSLSEGHGKNRRNQKRYGGKGLWEPHAVSQRKVRNQETVEPLTRGRATEWNIGRRMRRASIIAIGQKR